MSIEGAKDVAVEFNSFSKPFNMTGWRLGMALGCPTIISAMAQVKSNTDSGVFNAVQYAGIAGLKQCAAEIDAMLAVYDRRRRLAHDTLNGLGWDCTPPRGTFYLWVRTPNDRPAAEVCAEVFEKAHVVLTPGNAYGEFGEGYVRLSMTVSDARLEQAMDRLRKAFG